MKIVKVAAGGGYNVHIAKGLIYMAGEKLKEIFPEAKTIAVITDDNVSEIYLEPVLQSLSASAFSVFCISIPPGESSKNMERYFSVINRLCQYKITRSDVIAALGGGVVGDLAGFAASTYLRGVPFAQIPTTLLAMVDSSVGGKTGIDLEAGKNLAGTFYHPSIVLCDTQTLDTLPKQVYDDGIAEIIKYGMLDSGSLDVFDENIFLLLKRYFKENDSCEFIERLIKVCVSIKSEIVKRDEFDYKDRMLLNFGHTIAHAIEKLSLYKISHGFALAAGMAVDTRAAYRKGLCPKDCLDILYELLECFALPNFTHFSAQELYEAALYDKKHNGEVFTNIIPCALGECRLEKITSDDLLKWIKIGHSL